MENMKRRIPRRIAAARCVHRGLVLAALLLALLAGCARSDPETRLRADFQLLQSALDERRAGAFMDGISADFAGNQGLDRAALHNMLRLQMLGRASSSVTTGPLEVSLQGDTATVRFTAIATGGSGRFMPDSGNVYDVTTGWRDEGGNWRVYYAQWQPKRP